MAQILVFGLDLTPITNRLWSVSSRQICTSRSFSGSSIDEKKKANSLRDLVKNIG